MLKKDNYIFTPCTYVDYQCVCYATSKEFTFQCNFVKDGCI